MTTQPINLNDEDKRYNDEVCLLDGLYEFHPTAFEALTPSEWESISMYYLTSEPAPVNIFEHGREMRNCNPTIVQNAQEALTTLRNNLGME